MTTPTDPKLAEVEHAIRVTLPLDNESAAADEIMLAIGPVIRRLLDVKGWPHQPDNLQCECYDCQKNAIEQLSHQVDVERQGYKTACEHARLERTALMKAVEIIIEGKPGAAQNAVREDYPELTEALDALIRKRVAEARREEAKWWYQYAYWMKDKKPAPACDERLAELERATKAQPAPKAR